MNLHNVWNKTNFGGDARLLFYINILRVIELRGIQSPFQPLATVEVVLLKRFNNWCLALDMEMKT